MPVSSTPAATGGVMRRLGLARLPLYALASHESEATFLQQWAPVLQALAKLSELRVFKAEAGWAAAAQAAPVAVVGEARLCLHMEVDVAAEKARLGKGHAPGRRDRQGQGQAVQRGFCVQGATGRDRAGDETCDGFHGHVGQGA